MSGMDPSFFAELTEQERTHFRNMVLIRPQLPTPGQLQLIGGMARTLSSPRLLTLIARTPHWLAHGPILQALSENDFTPESIRRDLEMAVSLFDLMYEMDRAPADEKEERAEMVKALYQQLPPDLKPIVKQQAKQLARPVSSTGTTMEFPPLPDAEQDWETLTQPPKAQKEPPILFQAPREELLEKAANTPILDEIPILLSHPDEEIRVAALHHPMLSESLLEEALHRCTIPALLDEVYHEARWYFRDSIRWLIYEHPLTSQELAKSILITRDLVSCLEQGARKRRDLHRIASLFTQLDENEYQYITYWAKKSATNLLRVIKIFFDRLQRKRTTQLSGLPSRAQEGRWSSIEDREFNANQATQPEQIAQVLRDPDPKVFAIVLENPGLTLRELLVAIPTMDQSRVEKLAAHRTWGENPSIREALLHNVNLTEATALRLLKGMTVLRSLLDLLRDSRVTNLELKQQAVNRLRDMYLGMPIQKRIIAIRSSGGELFRHIPADTLKDEETLGQLVSDRQLDPNILLRLARNKQTPRAILEKIASHPILLAQAPIMSELLLNPKTPREASIRIWGLLSESEQQQLLRSPHLPTTLRHLS